MTALQVIQQVDGLRPNTYSTGQKILWIGRLEAMVKRLVIDAHKGGETVQVPAFLEDGDPERTLFLPDPFDVAYLYWLEAQIHYANEEIELYNSAIRLFSDAYRAFQLDYHGKHGAGALGRFRF